MASSAFIILLCQLFFVLFCCSWITASEQARQVRHTDKQDEVDLEEVLQVEMEKLESLRRKHNHDRFFLLKVLRDEKLRAKALKVHHENIMSGLRETQTNLKNDTARLQQTVNTLTLTVQTLASNVREMEVKVQGLEVNNALLNSTNEQLILQVDEIKRLASRASYGAACGKSKLCSTPFSECRNDRCDCIAGRSYNRTSDECVTSCTTYGSTFQEIPGMIITGYNAQSFRGLSEERCKQKCIEATRFVCKTIDLDTDGNCFLQPVVKDEVLSSWIPNTDFIHYQRDCF